MSIQEPVRPVVPVEVGKKVKESKNNSFNPNAIVPITRNVKIN